MKLTFLGATGTVTGSKYLLETAGYRVLVDCGLFQGHKELRLRNWAPLPISPQSVDAVILTHAHIDHSGYLPLFVKHGFRGPIYASAATIDLCGIMLPDSGYLQEEDAERANRYGYSKHHPAQPLYTQADAEACLGSFREVDFATVYPLEKTVGSAREKAKGKTDTGLTFSLHRAGHILGSAMVAVHENHRSLVFSGDLGRPHDPVMRAPAPPPPADTLVLESTYGNRRHEAENPLEVLATLINQTVHRGGSVLIPAFAVGRAQSLLYYLYQLKAQGRLPHGLPIYLDSPMAIDATHLLKKHAHEHQLSKEECHGLCSVATYVNTAEQSKRIAEDHIPQVILSASGMATGGRVLHHLKRMAPDHRNLLLFSGFQAGGTRGDRILRGETEIKIHGQQVPVRCQVENLGNTSAHADAGEMLDWLGRIQTPPKTVFLTHGEPDASQGLKAAIEERFGWNVIIPDYQDSVTV